MTTPSSQTDTTSTLLSTMPSEGALPFETIAQDGAFDGLKLRWLDSTNQQNSFPLGPSPIKIGSGPKCEVRLIGAGLKPLHAVISLGQSGFVIRRWGADTLLNGEAFQESFLSHGDRLSIGPESSTVIQIEVTGPVETTEQEDPSSDSLPIIEELDDSNIEEPNETSTSEDCQTETNFYQENSTEEPDVAVATESENQEATTAEITNNLWEIESYSDQDSLLGTDDSEEAPLAETPESTETWSSEAGSSEAGSSETWPSENGLTEPLSFDDNSDSQAYELELAAPVEAQTVEKTVEVTSRVSRDRLTNNYLRVKRLVAFLRAEREQLVETNYKIELFAEQLDLLHQQMNDSSAENAALNQRIIELEHQLEAACCNDEATSSETIDNSDFESVAVAPTHPAEETESFEALPEVSIDPAIELPSSESLPTQEQIDEISTNEESNDLWDLEQQTPTESHQFEQIDEAESSGSTELSESENDLNQDIELPVGSLLAEFQQETGNLEATHTVEVQPEVIDESSVNSNDNQEEPEKDPYEPASFIEQYSHLVPEEDASAEEAGYSSAQLATEVPTQSDNLPAEPMLDSSDSEDDESVDDYMAKMMARIRGEAPAETAPSPKSKTTKSSTEPAAIAPSTSDSSIDNEEHIPSGPPIMNLSELKGIDAPEINTDMAALRSLANSSARDAIEVARSRQWREKVTSKIAVIGLGFGGSIIGIITSPNLFGFQFLLSTCFAAIWSYIGLKSLLKAQADATLDADLTHSQAHPKQELT